MDLTEKEIKVSVVIAVYNSQKYLRQTLDSVLAQTLQDIEIICVDDGSEDASVSILEEYACLDDRILILHQTKQSDGAAQARNLGLAHARGQYLAVLDSDDFFEPDMLETAYRKAEDAQADIVIYDGYVFDEQIHGDKESGLILRSEHLPKDREVFAPDENAERLFLMTVGAAWNCLIKRGLVEAQGICFHSFHHADDLGFVYLSFACADRIAVLKKRLIHYRINNKDSQAANIGKWPQTAYQAFDRLKTELMLRGLYEKFKVSFVQAAVNYMIFYFENMRDYGAFIKLYEKVQNKYLEELDILNIPSEKFVNPHWAEYRDALRNMAVSEFLYRKMYKMFPFKEETAWKRKVSDKAKIVIYGAGKAGTELFGEIFREKRYQVQAWVDQQYEKIGYPVVSPECLKTLNYDYVLVAVEDEGLYQTICAVLEEYEAARERILWVMER